MKIIDLTNRIDTKRIVDEWKTAVERAITDCTGDKTKEDALLDELRKQHLRLELLSMVLAHGFDPRDFLRFDDELFPMKGDFS